MGKGRFRHWPGIFPSMQTAQAQQVSITPSSKSRGGAVDLAKRIVQVHRAGRPRLAHPEAGRTRPGRNRGSILP